MENNESHYINPFIDLAFKRIFGEESNKSLLIDFLNNLLVGERHIVSLDYRDKQQVPDESDGHSTIYDIYCKTDDDEYIIVEMQNKAQPQFLSRTVYYASQAIAKQGRGMKQWKYDVKAVYCIAFMNFTDPHLESKMRVDAALCDLETGTRTSDLLRFVYLQLPLFKKEADECRTFFERWLYVLKNMEILDDLPEAFQCESFKKLKEVSDLATMNEDERSQYEAIQRKYWDTWMMYDNSREEGLAAGREEGLAAGRAEGLAAGRAEGREKGLKEGRENGLKEGRADGRAEGLKEGREKVLKIARFMKSAGISLADIKEQTGLTDEEINSL
jgi:predicted transposase/invertase (TIGR01784 family)